MTTKILSTAIIIIVAFMGFKQGWAMLNGSESMLAMFSKWHFSRSALGALGVLTLAGALMVLFPQTFFLGNYIMVASILLVLCLHLSTANLKGAAVEVPFILMNLMLIYFQYPTIKVK